MVQSRLMFGAKLLGRELPAYSGVVKVQYSHVRTETTCPAASSPQGDALCGRGGLGCRSSTIQRDSSSRLWCELLTTLSVLLQAVLCGKLLQAPSLASCSAPSGAWHHVKGRHHTAPRSRNTVVNARLRTCKQCHAQRWTDCLHGRTLQAALDNMPASRRRCPLPAQHRVQHCIKGVQLQLA